MDPTKQQEAKTGLILLVIAIALVFAGCLLTWSIGIALLVLGVIMFFLFGAFIVLAAMGRIEREYKEGKDNADEMAARVRARLEKAREGQS